MPTDPKPATPACPDCLGRGKWTGNDALDYTCKTCKGTGKAAAQGEAATSTYTVTLCERCHRPKPCAWVILSEPMCECGEEAACSWCKIVPSEAAARHEGPHSTWCVRFRESQRGGEEAAEPCADGHPLDAALGNIHVIALALHMNGDHASATALAKAHEEIQNYLVKEPHEPCPVSAQELRAASRRCLTNDSIMLRELADWIERVK